MHLTSWGWWVWGGEGPELSVLLAEDPQFSSKYLYQVAMRSRASQGTLASSDTCACGVHNQIQAHTYT